MNYLDFIDPVSLEKPDEYYISNLNILGRHITIHTAGVELQDLGDFDLVLLGIPEDRNSLNKGSSLAPDKIRAQLYQLIKADTTVKILDLGNLRQGNTFKDTYIALREVMGKLLESHVVVTLLGGTQELTLPVFQTLESTGSGINLTTIDRTIDIVRDSVDTNSESYLTELLFKKRVLFNFHNIGHQAHVTDKENVDLINKLYHDSLRLGVVRADMKSVEPIMRDADIVSFDISAIRMADAPAHFNPSPTGFSAEEACQLARYAGISDRLSVFGIFEVNPKMDHRDQTARVAALMTWYFIDGLACRNPETPDSESHNFKTFIVGHSDLDHEITFYKSLRTERWWMEIPDPKNNSTMLISCSYTDYQNACEQEVPDIWWKAYQKLT